MPTDRTRPSDDLRQGYRGVRFQQGRVVLDRDLNAGEEISAAEFRFVGLDVVGPFGSPDDGYKIIPATTTHDFGISSGSIYVGGVRITLPSATTYFTQPDSLTREDAKPADAKPWNELVYLRVSQVEVSAREDGDLADVGLGGPDSAGRVRMLARVERMPTTAADCTGAFAELVTKSKDLGFKFDAPTHLLLPRGKLLKVAFDTTTTAATLCQPEAAGGYLHPDNQCVRIKRTAADELIWGFDNASFLYTIDETLPITTTTTLKILPAPPDASRYPKANQYVELLRAVAELPQGGFLAEPDGFVTKLTSDYDPDTGQVILTGPVPTPYQDAKHKLFLRVWESKVEADGRLIAVSAPAGPTGLRVELADGEAKFGPAVNSYWVFAPRPMTPQKVYPERFTIKAQIADGPYDWIAPLAFLKWPTAGPLTKADISDCRPHFDNLVELTDREPVATGGGCCTITVTPEDVKKVGDLRSWFETIRKDHKGQLHLCFRPGSYHLTRPVVLDESFAGTVLHGCPGARWEASPDVKGDDLLDGLLVLAGCADITIQGLHFLPGPTQILKAFIARWGDGIGNALSPIKKDYETALAAVVIRAINATRLTVETCEFTFPTKEALDLFAAAVYCHGDCTGLRLIGCRTQQPREAARVSDPNRGVSGELSRHNLKLLVAAFQEFQLASKGKAPQFLGELLPHARSSVAPFLHPMTRKAPPTGWSPSQVATWVNDNADYAYLPIRDNRDSDSPTVLFHEKESHGATRVNLAMSDGTIKSVAVEFARELIARSGGELVGAAINPPARAWFAVLANHLLIKPSEEKPVYSHRPILDEVTCAENTFVGLSVPVMGVGDVGTVEIRDNRSTDCTGGVWLTTPEAGGLALRFTETKFGATVANLFPPPNDIKLPGDPSVRPLDFAVQIVANHFDARSKDPVFSAPVVCVLGDPPPVKTVNLATLPLPRVPIQYRKIARLAADRQTVLLSANTLTSETRLIGQEFTVIFDATVLMAHIDTTTITGNVIENAAVASGDRLPPVLVLAPRNGGATPGDKVAITGNILYGRTDWDFLKRSGSKPSWRDYNSEI